MPARLGQAAIIDIEIATFHAGAAIERLHRLCDLLAPVLTLKRPLPAL